MSRPSLDRYLEIMAEQGRRPGNVRFEMAALFDRVPLEGRTVLDIGAGRGDTSFYAAACGAKRVVALEPEAAGSNTEMQTWFEWARDQLHAHQVVLHSETLQEFASVGESFDVLVSKASINHLDEEACIRLHRDPRARQIYREILDQLGALATPDGHLVIVDCSRNNLFASIGLRNPIAPTIEWEKHQPPAVWAELLHEAGWQDPRTRWLTFNSLRRPGQFLFGNRICAYLTTSGFCLTMKRRVGA